MHSENKHIKGKGTATFSVAFLYLKVTVRPTSRSKTDSHLTASLGRPLTLVIGARYKILESSTYLKYK